MADGPDAEVTGTGPTATGFGGAASREAVPDRTLQVGDRIRGLHPDGEIRDLYEIRAVHPGGIGIVYCAYNFVWKRLVALKTLRPKYAHNPRIRELFLAEGRTWVRLGKHPYLVRAVNVREIDGQPFVVAEYIDSPEGMGNDLRTWLGHERLSLRMAVEMALEIAQAMQHAVQQMPGLVHRDLKPANILVDAEGHARVTDFGLSRSTEDPAGTPVYMAPEQWLGEAQDARTDIYAYGCVLYEMFTGRRTHTAQTTEEWRAAHLEHAPEPLRVLDPNIPEELEAFVLRCLASRPEDRPRGWGEIVDLLAPWYERLTGHTPIRDFSEYDLTSEDLLMDASNLARLGGWEEALNACERALAVNPNDAIGWVNKSQVLLALKRIPEAQDAVERSLEIDPTLIGGPLELARMLRDLRRYPEALAAVDRALAIDAAYAPARALKQIILDEQKK
jgi:serine/threonine protein kinase